jgi:hypothetical protein
MFHQSGFANAPCPFNEQRTFAGGFGLPIQHLSVCFALKNSFCHSMKFFNRSKVTDYFLIIKTFSALRKFCLVIFAALRKIRLVVFASLRKIHAV